MQGKALVVNPAVIQPSAPPTIVGRAKKWRSFLGGTCEPTLEKSKKTLVPGRTRDTHRIHGIHGRTDHTDEPHNHPKFQNQRHSSTGPHDHATADTGRLWKESRRRSWSVSQAGKPIRSYYTRSWCRSLINGRRAAYFPPERDYARSMATS